MTFENRITLEIALLFIRKYRNLEKSPLKTGYDLLAKLDLPEFTYQHLCRHWKSKKKYFAEFFLNLGSDVQIRLLHQWEIIDPRDEEYLFMKQTEPVSVLFAEPPATLKSLRNLLVFFYNHAIEPFPAYQDLPGLELTVVPAEAKRFGNSANWGNYILSLDDPGYVVSQILNYPRT